ncbi:MAG: hypothetical protein IPP07_29095 [Holophagales bacterium]|nr:hypothetical protein [Holophagales bacterium]
MNGQQVLWLVIIAGVAVWFWKRRDDLEGLCAVDGAGRVRPHPAARPPASPAKACLTAVEQASRRMQEAATVFARTPIDPAAFSAASDGASSAISSADGKCSGGGSTAEQRAMEEARGALSEMRAILLDLAGALSGNGSASDVPRRQESIDRHLDAARLALRG